MASKKKNKHSFLLTSLRIASVIPLFFKTAKNLIELIQAETELAKRKIIWLMILGALFGLVLLSVWMCLLAVLFVYLISLQLTSLMSLFMILLLNIFILIIIGLMILNIKHALFFPETRKFLMQIKKKIIATH